MKRLILLVMLCMGIGYAAGEAIRFESNQQLPITPDYAIRILESARSTHEYWAAREVVPGQDAEWVERYSQIIELIKILEAR